MATKRTRTSRTRRVGRSAELEELGKALRDQVDPADRSSDPLLVPHLEPLERVLEAEEVEDPYALILESICGATDDSQPVEQYDGTLGVTAAFVNAHERAVAQVQWNANLASVYTNPGDVSGVRWGTGVMISPELFLTAGHLFDQTGGGWNRPRVNGTTNVISPQEIGTNMHLNFNFQVDPAGNPRTEESFAITQLIEYRIGGIDFAVCRIAANPGNTYGWATVSTVDAAVGDTLCVIGHPAGQRKRIEAGPTTQLSGNQIRYNDIDTLGGNSGSGIIHEASGQIVGVHTNGGCNAAGTGSNFGMRISAIRAQSPTITNLGATTGIIADLGTAIVTDIQPTLARFDKNTWDDIGTRVVRDVQPTLPRFDKPVWDDIGTRVVRDVISPTKRFDDVKIAGYDKQWDIPGQIDPGLIDPPYVNPGGLGQLGAGRPFVLSTPHHSPVLGGQAAQGMATNAYDAALAQLEAAISANQQSLVQLAEQLEALRDEYQEALGGGPGG